ncbi:hypothetical protein [Listeria goaensis]|uniref:hypothetical protein n=1 Tax=Listeria goaensis TaxID=1649188 RepID=UPI000B596647|nr:hypothetical protein [Listeria goaensis]
MYYRKKAKGQGPFVPAEYWRRNAPMMGKPGSRITHAKLSGGRKEKSTVIYDKFGRQRFRVDHGSHGYKDHTKPHLHYYKYTRGTIGGKGYRYNIYRYKKKK